MAITVENQFISNKLKEVIDNFAFQHLLSDVSKLELNKDELVVFELGACQFTGKQRVYVKRDEAETTSPSKNEREECFICAKPITERVIAYQFTDDEGKVNQIYCLESEAEDLISE